MSKKKKKQKPHKTSPGFKTIKFKQLVPEIALMTPFIMFDYGEHNNNTIAKSSIRQDMEAFIISHRQADSQNRIRQLMTTMENDIVPFFNNTAAAFINSHECDKDLNIYDNQSKINTQADILDFTEYEDADHKKDILAAAIDRLAQLQPDETDISLLWSTNEYIRIHYSPSTDYLVRRIGYNNEAKAVTYEIIGLEHRILVNDKVITIPSFIAEIMTGLTNEKNIETSVDLDGDDSNITCNKDIVQWISIKHASQFISGTTPSNYIFPVFAVTKLSFVSEYDEFVNTCTNRIFNTNNFENKSAYRTKPLFKTIYQELTANLFGNPSDHVAYLRQKMSIAIACIIMTNVMLTSEKLSSTRKGSKDTTVTYVASENKQDVTKHKTRHLGRIKITSEKKPSAPSMKKIIRYSTAEWSRRGFVRHYKSGKTVFVKPTTVKRKCIDISGTEKAVNTTEYIIHSDSENPAKNSPA